MNRLIPLALATALIAGGPAPALAFDFDHQHGVLEHHGGEIGQASRPTAGHAHGSAGLARLEHRHHVFPECDHAGHGEVIDEGCCAHRAASPCSTASEAAHPAPDHTRVAAHADSIADHRCCTDLVHVTVPTGYAGLDGHGYHDRAEVQLDYAFHHLSGAEVGASSEALEAAGLIPARSGFRSERLERVLANLKAAGIDPRAKATGPSKSK